MVERAATPSSWLAALSSLVAQSLVAQGAWVPRAPARERAFGRWSALPQVAQRGEPEQVAAVHVSADSGLHWARWLLRAWPAASARALLVWPHTARAASKVEADIETASGYRRKPLDCTVRRRARPECGVPRTACGESVVVAEQGAVCSASCWVVPECSASCWVVTREFRQTIPPGNWTSRFRCHSRS